MNHVNCIWDDADDLLGNVHHLDEHGFSVEDVEEVLRNPTDSGVSRATGRPCVWGYTPEDLYIIVIFD